MGIIYPNSMLSKPRGLVASGFDPISAFGSDLALWLDPSYGVYTDRSTQLTAASTQHWSRAHADASSLAFGDVDFWGGAWIYADTLPAQYGVCGKGTGPGWLVYYTGGNMFFQAYAALAYRAFSTTGAWAYLFWYHDAVNDQIAISVNGGAFGTAAVSGGPGAVVAPFYAGTYSGATDPMDGRLDSLVIGASPVGGIAALATTIRDYLYNSGSGRVYADLSAAQATAWGLVSAWDFDGDGLDSHGSNDLTAVNSPTYTSGIASGIAGDGDVVSLVDARTGPNCGPPSYAGRPLWVANAGKPYFSFDGSNDSISFGDVAAWDRGTGAFTLMFAAKGGDNGDMVISKSDYVGTDNGIYIHRAGGGAHWRYYSVADDISFGADSGAASIFTVVRSGTSAGQVSVRRNGVEIATGIDSRTLSNSKALVFGDSADAGHSLNGRLGDVVFVARALTAGELAQLEAWAAARQAA